MSYRIQSHVLQSTHAAPDEMQKTNMFLLTMHAWNEL